MLRGDDHYAKLVQTLTGRYVFWVILPAQVQTLQKNPLPPSVQSTPKVQTTEQLRIVGVIVRLVFLDPEQSRGEIITPEINYFPNKNVKGVHPLC
jgi:hypothetical protein